MAITAGYDVGGAHLKVALAEDGRTIAVQAGRLPAVARPRPARRRLCRGRRPHRPRRAARGHHDRRAVRVVPRPAQRRARDPRSHLATDARCRPCASRWARAGLATPRKAMAEPASVASTNFLASAALVARGCPTRCSSIWARRRPTSLPSPAAQPCPRGITDGERLATGELVYTGLTRTDVSVVTQRAKFQGREQRLAAGGFANMADVRRILGELPEGVDQHGTADGRGKSVEESVARFARCFGRDAVDASIDDWRAAAREIADKQMTEVRAAVDEVLAAAPLPAGSTGRRRRYRRPADRGSDASARATDAPLRRARQRGT